LINEPLSSTTPPVTLSAPLTGWVKLPSSKVMSLIRVPLVVAVGVGLSVAVGVAVGEVVVAAPERRLDELMNTQLVTVTPETDREDVAHLVSFVSENRSGVSTRPA
jgi:CBS domain-containing protein